MSRANGKPKRKSVMSRLNEAVARKFGPPAEVTEDGGRASYSAASVRLPSQFTILQVNPRPLRDGEDAGLSANRNRSKTLVVTWGLEQFESMVAQFAACALIRKKLGWGDVEVKMTVRQKDDGELYASLLVREKKSGGSPTHPVRVIPRRKNGI